MSQDLVAKSEKRDYTELFIYELNWGAPDHAPITVELEDGTSLTATNVSSYKGLRVWEVPAYPGTKVEAKVDQAIAKSTTNRLVIFHEPERQAWRWPSRSSRGGGVVSRPARHVHRTGVTDPRFGEKLEAIKLPTDIVLDVNAVLTRVRAAFDVETSNESKRASKLMARMYAAVEKAYPAGYDPKQRDHEISVSLARVLFLLFGDDTEMWSVELFQDFIKDHTARDGSDMGARLNELFRTLDTAPAEREGSADGLAAFPYVNGGIFQERITLPDLGPEFRDAVLAAAAVDWSSISPAIFGSMFQSVRDAEIRRELGEHYTSEENILKTLNPLFLDELRAEFEVALRRDTPRKQANALQGLWTKLGEIRYMDPACGCGNFIIVAYRELRELELRILDALTTIQQGADARALETDWTHTLKVTLDHFYGIEIDEWPARIAETAMFLVDRQCDLRMEERFGKAPERLPIQRAAHITVGNAVQLDWSEILTPTESTVIAGNPPFIGQYTKTPQQTEDAKAAWGADYDGYLDYVTSWHAKAMQFFSDVDGLWAYVTTNSTTQGQATPALFDPLQRERWKIKFAHQTFPWTSEATGKAAVHCVIVGFSRAVVAPRLFTYPVPDGDPVEANPSNINPYLLDGPDLLVRKTMRPVAPGLPEVQYGSKPVDGSHLQVSPAELAAVQADPIAAKYLRPFVGADELLNGAERWCLWLESASPTDIAASDVLTARTDGVREMRSRSTKPSTRKAAATPHLFTEMRQPKVPYLGIPIHVSENRAFFTTTRFAADVIAGNANFTAADPDGFLFAIISSSMFITWQRMIGGRLKSDLRFSNTIVWNNLPLPAVDAATREKIVKAGQGVVDARNLEPGKSLADLYAPQKMSVELLAAHELLDELVDRAFGSLGLCGTETERMQILFDRFAEQTRRSRR